MREGRYGAGGPVLAGRVALVTGGGRGLGRAMALAFASAGADVALAARSIDQLAGAAAEVTAIGRRSWILPADLGAVDGPSRLAAQIQESCPPVDIVLHAAGIQVRKPALEIAPEEWDCVMAVNVRAGFFLSVALMRQQPASPPRRHIFVASLTSTIGIANTSAYGASKSAVAGVVRSLAVEWAPRSVTVNAIQPGYFHTGLTDAVFRDSDRRKWIESRVPLGRIGVGEDLGGAAVFLASDAAGYITGQVMAVDGGWLAS